MSRQAIAISLCLVGCSMLPPKPVDTSPPADTSPLVDTGEPPIVGWEHAEVEPNDVGLNEDVTLVAADLGQADVLPEPSLGVFTDLIHGQVSLETDTPGWVHPLDAYALTAPVDLDAIITFSCEDPTADHDLLLYDAEGVYVAYSLYDDPEVIETEAWGIAMTAGSTWYIVVLPYSGQVGDTPYRIGIRYEER